MNCMREKSASTKSLGISKLALIALGAALVVSAAPVAIGQAQAGAGTAAPAAAPAPAKTQTQAKPQASGGTSGASQTSATAAAGAEPQMEDQSAPPAESLGEAARKARAQKAKANTPKVFTDESVSHLSGHGVSVVGDGSGSGSSDAGNAYAGNSGGGAAGSQEQYWRGKAQAIRSQMAQCDQQISKLQDDIAKNGAVSVDPQSGLQAGVIFVEDRNAEIKKIEEQKTALQGQLDELEDEGRKAGADSGWFR